MKILNLSFTPLAIEPTTCRAYGCTLVHIVTIFKITYLRNKLSVIYFSQQIPLTMLMKRAVFPKMTDRSISPKENELRALSSFFKKSCIVGQWSPDPKTTSFWSKIFFAYILLLLIMLRK